MRMLIQTQQTDLTTRILPHISQSLQHPVAGSMAGIQDVAKLAGVSASTVSNVINGRSGKMRAETRERVIDAIERLKFTPNGAARQLKSGHNTSLGLIIPSAANPFWGAVAHQVERAARKRGYRLLICNAERDPEVEQRYGETLLGSRVMGVILGSSPLSFDHLRDLIARGLKVAAFDQRARDDGNGVACSVSVDQELGGMLAAQHLIGCGHRRIGIVTGPVRTNSRVGRVQGARTALARAGIAFDETLLWQGGGVVGFGDMEGAELGRSGVRELLSRDDPPTAVICGNDIYALGAYAGARDLGYRVPEDLSIVGFDDIALSEIVHPPLTTIRQPVAAMAEMVVDLLIRCVEEGGEPRDENFVQVRPQLIVRGSTGPARKRPPLEDAR
jgi:DNA-binding LacI/PurR family transcriptional regulator